MVDQLGRQINYARLSITGDCNLRCIYCREASSSTTAYCGHSKSKSPLALTNNLLSVSQYGKLVNALGDVGINKIRITGGEPLVRKDLEKIVETIRSNPKIEKLSMTTNGQGLANRIRDLKSAGLSSINISIDSLIPEKYWSITRGGSLADVLAGVRTSLEIGMNPVKINVVVIKGVNDSEIPGFIEWTRYLPLDVRFIELMPIGRLGQGSENRLSSQEILRLHPEFQPVQPRETGQPSQDYIIPGYKGRIGLISPITHKFCSGCNRIRVSHDGKLKLCLGQNQEFDLKPYLDSSRSELARILSDRVFLKPEGHFFDQDFHSYRTMNDIGG